MRLAAANTWGRIPQPSLSWVIGSGNLGTYLAVDIPATAQHFFNTTNSFCFGASLTASPVPPGYAAQPLLSLDAYTGSGGLAALLSPPNQITYNYNWVMYDLENWSESPTAEKQSPPVYMEDFGNACHTAGGTGPYKVIFAPGQDLYGSATGAYAPLPGPPVETNVAWFTRVICPTAAYCDIFLLQNEAYQGSGNYVASFTGAVAACKAANPDVLVFAEVSTANATAGTEAGKAAQMATAAQSIAPDGFFVAMPSPDQVAGEDFFTLMQAAGY